MESRRHGAMEFGREIGQPNPWAIWLTATENDKLAGYLDIQYGADSADISHRHRTSLSGERAFAKLLLQEMEQRLIALSLQWITYIGYF